MNWKNMNLKRKILVYAVLDAITVVVAVVIWKTFFS